MSESRRPRSAANVLAFETVVERHGPGVLRFCVARLGADPGEEAFQETLLAALCHYEELREPGAVGGWLFSIAQRKIVDVARARREAPISNDQLEQHAAVWYDPQPESGGGPWSQVARLPPRQREAVALRFLADLPHADIAKVMDISVQAARRNVFEGLKRLRKNLTDDPDDL